MSVIKLTDLDLKGRDALMRASDVTLPSFTGTLRSARIRPRLPLRSSSVNLITDIVLLTYLNVYRKVAEVAKKNKRFRKNLCALCVFAARDNRSEEHTSEL